MGLMCSADQPGIDVHLRILLFAALWIMLCSELADIEQDVRDINAELAAWPSELRVLLRVACSAWKGDDDKWDFCQGLAFVAGFPACRVAQFFGLFG